MLGYFTFENRLERRVRGVIRKLEQGSRLVGPAYDRDRVMISADARQGAVQVIAVNADTALRNIRERLVRDGYTVSAPRRNDSSPIDLLNIHIQQR